MPAWEFDKRALAVLNQAIRHEMERFLPGGNPPPTEDEYEYALKAGYWSEVEPVEHDELIRRLQSLAEQIDPKRVAESFVAGVGQKRPDLRSSIASYVLASSISEHEAKLRPDFPCLICETWLHGEPPMAKIDRNGSLGSRWAEGGVLTLEYALADLEWFVAAPPVEASQADWEAFRELINDLRRAPEKCAAKALSKLMGKRIGANEMQRQRTLEVLSAIGVLEPRLYPSFWRAFTPYEDRARLENINDWEYPMRLWRGCDGVNEEAVSYWFGQ